MKTLLSLFLLVQSIASLGGVRTVNKEQFESIPNALYISWNSASSRQVLVFQQAFIETFRNDFRVYQWENYPVIGVEDVPFFQCDTIAFEVSETLREKQLIPDGILCSPNLDDVLPH